MAKQHTGWKHWNLKRLSLKTHVYCAASYKVVIGRVLQLPKEKWDDELVGKIVDSLDTWEDHTPTSEHGEFFKTELIARISELGGRPSQDVEWVITNGSFEEFCTLFQEPLRSRMSGSDPASSNAHRQIWVDGTDEVQHLAHEGFETGRVDYKLYYGSPSSHNVWIRVVDAGDYHQYFECLDCIHKLIESPLWINGFRGGKFDGVVMLGAGSGDKDQELLQSMVALRTDNTHTISYTLIDYSFYMLDATRRQLDDFLARKLQASAVHIEPLRQDFLAFRDTHKRIRPSKRNVVWIIPGGTFDLPPTLVPGISS